MKLKKVDSQSSEFFVAEDENYSTTLARNYYEDIQKINLYRVVHNFKTEEIFVLAESFSAAISQASCKFGQEQEKFLTVKMIPFLVRGWGRQQF